MTVSGLLSHKPLFSQIFTRKIFILWRKSIGIHKWDRIRGWGPQEVPCDIFLRECVILSGRRLVSELWRQSSVGDDFRRVGKRECSAFTRIQNFWKRFSEDDFTAWTVQKPFEKIPDSVLPSTGIFYRESNANRNLGILDFQNVANLYCIPYTKSQISFAKFLK